MSNNDTTPKTPARDSQDIPASEQGDLREYEYDLTEEDLRPPARKWKFRVQSKKKPGIPPLEVEAHDEAEAIRQFVLMRRELDGSHIKSHMHSFKVTCLDPARRRELLQQYSEAGVRPPTGMAHR